MHEINRPEWDEIWMKMAETISLRSHHPRWKVGAIIITSDNTQVLSLGYNGNAAGLKNRPDSMSPGKCGMIHAEINALLKLDYNRTYLYICLKNRKNFNKYISTTVYVTVIDFSRHNQSYVKVAHHHFLLHQQDMKQVKLY